jgi:hypothetical protein
MKESANSKIHISSKYQISLKYVQREPSCSMRINGRTDMAKLTIAFRNFAKVPKKSRYNIKWKMKDKNSDSRTGVLISP